MHPRDDDRPLGVPVSKSRPKAGLVAVTANNLSEPQSPPGDLGRHPSDEVGLPRQIPSQMHAPTDNELAAIRRSESAEAERLYAQVVQTNLGRYSSWGRRADKTLFVALLALLALLALFVFAQTVQILAALAVQPIAIKVLGYAGLTAIVAVLLFFAVRLLILFFRLRVNQQISSTQMQELSRRAELRALVQRDKSTAKKNLQGYLEAYPLDAIAASGAPGLFQMDPATIQKLRDARDLLLDQDRFSDYDGWLRDFQLRFQEPLQGEADAVVRNWMRLVGIKTALSPYALLDSIIVLYCSYGMIGDLCRIYNLRMTKPGLVRLMAYTLFNAYAAGQIEDHAPDLAQIVEPTWLVDAVHAIGGGLADKIVGKALPKVASGAANAVLTYKLGKATIALLRPVEPR